MKKGKYFPLACLRVMNLGCYLSSSLKAQPPAGCGGVCYQTLQTLVALYTAHPDHMHCWWVWISFPSSGDTEESATAGDYFSSSWIILSPHWRGVKDFLFIFSVHYATEIIPFLLSACLRWNYWGQIKNKAPVPRKPHWKLMVPKRQQT